MWSSSIPWASVVLLLGINSASSLVLHATRSPGRPSGARKGATFASSAAVSDASSTLEAVPFRYVTNITVNGQNFRVAIDTGSSDLWISAPSDLLLNDTGMPVELFYGASAVTTVNGTLAFGAVELGGYTFSEQAFVSATEVGLGAILEVGLDGLIGFAFDGALASELTAAVESAGFDAAVSQPFLFNIFDQKPDIENFIAISLSRTGDLEDSADASFTINEIDETYAGVLNSKPIPIFPPEKRRWSLILDAVTVDGTSIPIPGSTVTSVTPVAAGNLVVLMDTGTPTAALPVDLYNMIYSNIPGALFSSSQATWVVPCNTTAIVTVVMSGQSFPIHPLDLTDIHVVDGLTVCTAAIFPGPGNADFDALFGDTIMRNIYSLFNFGSAIAKAPGGTSSMQLLSQTDPNAAIADVTAVRMTQLATGPPEGVPSSFSPLTFVEAPTTGAIAAAVVGSTAGPDLDSDSQIRKYAPIVIGLLGANLLVVLLLALIGLVLCVKRGEKSVTRQSKYVPVKSREEEARKSESYENKRYSD